MNYWSPEYLKIWILVCPYIWIIEHLHNWILLLFNNNSTTYWILLTILIKNPSISLRNNAESNHIHPKRYSSPMKESFPLLYREKKSSMNRNVKTYSISPLLSTLIMIRYPGALLTRNKYRTRDGTSALSGWGKFL